MPLHIDYRPKTFHEMKGNIATIKSLTAIFERESDWPHAILLQGPKGCGKTTIARILKTLMDCHAGDFVEINSSSDRGIATARKILEDAQYRPMYGKARVFLLDEVHQATKDFQNALLKPLEDCPAHSFYILCTTDPANLIAPLRSRCHTFEVQNLNTSQTIELLDDVLKAEDVDWITDAAKNKIYEAADGCPRDALKILDQVIDLQDDKEVFAAIQSYQYDESSINALWNALLRRNTWSRVSKIVSKMDLSNAESLRRAMITAMSTIILKEDRPEAAIIYECFKENYFNTGKAGFIFSCYQACTDLQ
jgi:DNA polymerase-3 subunit gamma/tau